MELTKRAFGKHAHAFKRVKRNAHAQTAFGNILGACFITAVYNIFRTIGAINGHRQSRVTIGHVKNCHPPLTSQ